MDREMKLAAAIATPSAGKGTTSLPADLVGASCKRVGTASLVIAGLWAFALFVNNVVLPATGLERPLGGQIAAWPMPGNVIALIGIVISAAMIFVVRRLYHRPGVLLDVGLGFEVATALLIGILDQWIPVLEPGRISWICIIILIYPAIAPSTPRKTLLAALAAASMDPLGLGITLLRNPALDVTFPLAVLSFLPNYVCAVLAVIPAHIVTKLGRHVKQARELGNYQLGEVVGTGGMGEVVKATHRLLARPAAIKLIRPELLGANGDDKTRVVLERFRREARAAATLRSPHTIELYDFGVSEDGTFYYVMELLDGMDLERLVERFGPVPAERAIHFMRQASLSLGEAHGLGLVHRDIKPSNLHTSRLGTTVDFVKVLDFGLVKNIGTNADPTLTAAEWTPGTPAFMSPESAQGIAADQRADIYSLGCVAYWLLTGQVVFPSNSAIGMMQRHIQDEPEPPSARTELDVPKEVDDLILACLAKQPADRPTDGEALERMCAAVDFSKPWTDERARRWWHTHYPAPAQGEPTEPTVMAPLLPSD